MMESYLHPTSSPTTVRLSDNDDEAIVDNHGKKKKKREREDKKIGSRHTEILDSAFFLKNRMM